MEYLALFLSISVVLILGAWIWVLKRRIGTLADQVAVLEVTQSSQNTGKKKVLDLDSNNTEEDNKPGIQTYTLE